MTKFPLPRVALAAFVLMLGGCATAPQPPIDIQLVALNDFHGNLEPSKFTYKAADGKEVVLQAGGIEAVASAVQAWRKQDPDLLFVGAGDLVGASPALSSMWADEPTINALGMIGFNITSVGNHEFDHGRYELLRKQRGGCESPMPDKACKLAPDFSGAKYTYLAANVVDAKTGQPFLPAYRIAEVKGVKIGFIGAVLKDAASVVLASGIEDLRFEDEAASINRVLPELRAQGVTVFVVLIHEGGVLKEQPFDQPHCTTLRGPIVGIAQKLDPAIRIIVSGHTHRGYLCETPDGRSITQAEMGGHVLTRLHLMVDPATHALRSWDARNITMKPGEYPPVPAVSAYLASVKSRSEAQLAQPVAPVAVRSVTRRLSPSGESALGDLVADAVLDMVRPQGVQVGFMNTAGMRKDFDVGADLVATYGQAQQVLPFGNTLVIMDLTGRQLREILESQWRREQVDVDHSTLQVSQSFTYQWDGTAPRGARLVPGSLKIDGVPVEDDKTYRVVANNFLAEGGDGFPTFAQGKNRVDTGIRDIDAFNAYLKKRAAAGQPAGAESPQGRIQRVK
ncbi:MAG: bifunctional metallophosphatase/5'-nucleotidase [Telluria sp.]